MCEANVYIPAEEVEAFLDAALNGNTTEVSTMLNRRWYLIDVPSDDDDTALMLATWNGNVDTVDMLCQHNATTFATNHEDKNVFDQVSHLEEDKIGRLINVLFHARNQEIACWSDPNRQHNRVTYKRNNKDGGVWCSYRMESGVSVHVAEAEGVDSNMMVRCP